MATFREDVSLLDLGRSVVSTQLASKNNLKLNFIEYKQSQERQLQFAKSDPLLDESGKNLLVWIAQGDG
jgi:hypothetical protein